jgi:hypothetical protein
MFEKVYCVHDYWDMTIINGIADYNRKKYYFNCIFSDDEECWTDIYELILLDDYIFKLSLDNWDYWKKWLKGFFNNGNYTMPHPVEYARSRRKLAVEKIFDGKNIGKDLIELTETYCQNGITIDEYLKNRKPIYKAKGIFSGDIDGVNDTRVEWENIRKI